jgi:hypothetical protein
MWPELWHTQKLGRGGKAFGVETICMLVDNNQEMSARVLYPCRMASRLEAMIRVLTKLLKGPL